jgi:hypothetical protein
MSLGAADFAASMGMQTTGIGGTQENYYMLHREGQKYWADPWHWAQAAIVAACRTHGVLPVDGPFGDFSDDEGFRAQALRSATLGMVGKWAIHPKQVALANEVFTPSEAVCRGARDLAAMDEAKRTGQGATVYKGRLVDIASIKQAEVIVRQAEMILAKAVRRKATHAGESRLPGYDDVKHHRCGYGPRDLRSPVGDEVFGLEPAGEHQAKRDGRIEMSARNAANGIGHGQDRQAEGKADAQPADAHIRHAGRQNRAATAPEHKPEGADELGDKSFH